MEDLRTDRVHPYEKGHHDDGYYDQGGRRHGKKKSSKAKGSGRDRDRNAPLDNPRPREREPELENQKGSSRKRDRERKTRPNSDLNLKNQKGSSRKHDRKKGPAAPEPKRAKSAATTPERELGSHEDAMDAVLARLKDMIFAKERATIPLVMSKQARTAAMTGLQNRDGDARFANVRDALGEFRTPDGVILARSRTQLNFHKSMLNASVAAIYGSDFDASEERIKEQNNWTEFRQEVLIVTARGEGKTWAVAMYVASLLMFCPAVSICVFAVAMRAAENVVRLVAQMLASHARGKDMNVRVAAQKITLHGPGGASDIRTFTALPNSSETTRGVHTDFVIVDEAAFISYKLFMETILPTITKKKTALIMISTPQGSDNIYTWLTSLLDTSTSPPRLMFNVIQASPVCPACINTDHAAECTHMRASVPPWKSLDKVARMESLYADDPHLHKRENLGLSADSEDAAFLKSEIDTMFANISNVPRDIRAVYLTLDPSGGGSSEFAAVAMVEDWDRNLSVPPPFLSRFEFCVFVFIRVRQSLGAPNLPCLPTSTIAW